MSSTMLAHRGRRIGHGSRVGHVNGASRRESTCDVMV